MNVAQKLIKKGVPKPIANKLANGDLGLPKQIRTASISRIQEVTGLNQSNASALKDAFTL